MSQEWPHIPNQGHPAHDQVVFSCGEKGFTVAEVLAAAWYRGELQPRWTDLLQEVGCTECATALELEPGEGELQTLSDEFRYDRDLLTTEEMERWLRQWDLTEEAFGEYFLRRYWRLNPPEGAEAITLDYEGTPLEWRELLRVNLVLSGEFDRMTDRLSWRVAATHSENEPIDETANAAERARFFRYSGLSDTSLPKKLAALGVDIDWWEASVRMESIYRGVCARLLTPERRARALPAMRLALTSIEIETMMAPSLEMAREGVFCLNENRFTMEQLAADCGLVCNREEVFIGDLAETVQQSFLSAPLGECLPPRECDDGFELCRLIHKTEPDLNHPEIIARIDQQLLAAHFSDLSSRYIRRSQGEGTVA